MDRPIERSPLQTLPSDELPPWLHRLETCLSTNRWAIDHPQLAAGDVIFTDRQTAGRGQNDRVWHGPMGVLTASIVVDGIALAQRSGLALRVGFAVIESIEALCPSLQGLLQLKWPNDLWIKGQKLAGILCEAPGSSGLAIRREGQSGSRLGGRIIVGVGLNRCPDWQQFEPSIAARSTSLQDHMAIVPEELAILVQLRQNLQVVADRLGQSQGPDPSTVGASLGTSLGASIGGNWGEDFRLISARDGLRDRRLTVVLGAETIVGIGRGFNDLGHLLIELPDRRILALSSGRVIDWEI
jgi:BirA family transcriptional regulator, biotin operon repressor / biotin---[acetyl-CoA-carboxylase] ligase